MELPGRIIAIFGAPAAGKSYLIRKLSEVYPLDHFMEGEVGDFPQFITENIGKNVNGLQTILYFHTLGIRQYREALQMKRDGKLVLLDAGWFSNWFYIDAQLPDLNERQLARDLLRETNLVLPHPDTIVFLQCPDDVIRARLKERGRGYEEDFEALALEINRQHEVFFAGGEARIMYPHSQLLTLRSDHYDLKDMVCELGIDPRLGAGQMTMKNGV